MKSAELTGQWEKQLKDIEKGTYSAATFINNMKKMVDELVYEVRSETKKANITAENHTKKKVKKVVKRVIPDVISCPKCKKGTVIKGKAAYGCSDYKTGCDFRFNFTDIKAKANGKKLTKELVFSILNG